MDGVPGARRGDGSKNRKELSNATLQGNVEKGNPQEVSSTSGDLTTRRFDDHNMNNFRGTMAKGVRNSKEKSLMQRM